MPMSNTASVSKNAALALADGTIFYGTGVGAKGTTCGEVCFNTSMTGYQEIISDPSYSGQIITFTFPHVGNVGTNNNDMEADIPVANGIILNTKITGPSSWRSTEHLDKWLKKHNLVGISGIDTRRLTKHIRSHSAQNGAIQYGGKLDQKTLKELVNRAKEWPKLDGMDLANQITCKKNFTWDISEWSINNYEDKYTSPPDKKFRVVAIDYGTKQNILRSLVARGCEILVLPATANIKDILAYAPDGIFLSNGPGDPAATIKNVEPTIKGLINSGKPVFGICLGHQLLSLALGAKTKKMPFGHRGANHPVKDLETGKVEITSQNHGFEVNGNTLPEGVIATHISLFDGSLEGLKVIGKPVFSVQYHPEASPGPMDSAYLFDNFVDLMESQK
ncbi:MAG: carbamoyl phosphate synthase small subunit [Rhodospirillaceae bacterium]|nr:carbamoyl phosphate synthase small subunit [Rhodospirillaceae bacterium]